VGYSSAIDKIILKKPHQNIALFCLKKVKKYAETNNNNKLRKTSNNKYKTHFSVLASGLFFLLLIFSET